MKLSTKLSALFFVASLAPLASQAQFTQRDYEGIAQVETSGPMPSRSNPDSVPVRFLGGGASHAVVQISNDSAIAMLKGTRAQVFFLNHVRSPKKKITKLVGNTISSIEVVYGDPLVRQYGDEAKDGVFTILTKEPEVKQKAEPEKGAKQAKQS